MANREVCTCTQWAWGGENYSFVFLSIVRHIISQHRTPAPRGIASQHLQTFERVLVNKELLTGTVLVNNLFQTIIQSLWSFLGNFLTIGAAERDL